MPSPAGGARRGPTACGNAYSAYPQMAGAEQALSTIMPHAGAVAQLAALEFAAGRVLTAAQAQPLYLRNKIAFTSAERTVINAEKAEALARGESGPR